MLFLVGEQTRTLACPGPESHEFCTSFGYCKVVDFLVAFCKEFGQLAKNEKARRSA